MMEKLSPDGDTVNEHGEVFDLTKSYKSVSILYLKDSFSAGVSSESASQYSIMPRASTLMTASNAMFAEMHL